MQVNNYNDIQTLSKNLLSRGLRLLDYKDPNLEKEEPGQVDLSPGPPQLERATQRWLAEHQTDGKPDRSLPGSLVIRVNLDKIPAPQGSPFLDPDDLDGNGANEWAATTRKSQSKVAAKQLKKSKHDALVALLHHASKTATGELAEKFVEHHDKVKQAIEYHELVPPDDDEIREKQPEHASA
jgi:hypothetical protein